MVRHLLEARGQAVGVLRPHGREGAQDDEIEGALKDFEPFAVFTGHRSEVDTLVNWDVK